MVVVIIIMGLGIDFGINYVDSFFEKRKEKGMGSKKAVRETSKELYRAMVGASMTTTAGFLALLFGILPAMKTLGIILAMGIVNTLISALFIPPVFVYLSDRKKRGSEESEDESDKIGDIGEKIKQKTPGGA